MEGFSPLVPLFRINEVIVIFLLEYFIAMNFLGLTSEVRGTSVWFWKALK